MEERKDREQLIKLKISNMAFPVRPELGQTHDGYIFTLIGWQKLIEQEDDCHELKRQRNRYKDALLKIFAMPTSMEGANKMHKIAKEALKESKEEYVDEDKWHPQNYGK
jgi:hypothetical protein